MIKQYQAVIFDVDGTLLDTTEGVTAAVRYTIEQHHLHELAWEELTTFIGPPIQDSFAKHFGISDSETLQELATTFRSRYKNYELFKAKPYEGIYELCDQLQRQGIVIAIATYKREDYAVEIIKHFGFDRYSHIYYGADHENRLKKADIIKKCLADIEIDGQSAAVMVGDTDNDALGAEEAGIDFIGVTYGFGFRDYEEVLKCKNATGYVERPLDILRFCDEI